MVPNPGLDGSTLIALFIFALVGAIAVIGGMVWSVVYLIQHLTWVTP